MYNECESYINEGAEQIMKKIESLQNPFVKEWKKLHTKKGREKSGLFLIEGLHLVEEAIKHNLEIREIIIEEESDLLFTLDTKDIPVISVTKEIINEVTDTETPQGIVAVCEKLNHYPNSEMKKLLLLDQVQDPGNVGTMIRTADCAGLDAVILGKGSVDVYNSKVIRSSQGSLFHIPVLEGDLLEWLEFCNKEEVPVYGTALKNSTSFQELQASESFAIILGNEGNGVSKDLLEATTENVYIPILGQAESLNVAVAAGILLYHFSLRG